MNLHILTVLYLIGYTAWGLGLIYFYLSRHVKSKTHSYWLLHQVCLGAGFLWLAIGGSGETPSFHIIASVLVLGAFCARFLAIATSANHQISKRFVVSGVVTVILLGVLYQWCQFLGAPLASLELIVLLPISVMSGLTAKYLFEHDLVRSVSLRGIAYALSFEALIFGLLAIGALAGLGQEFINLESRVVAAVVLSIYLLQFMMFVCWLIYMAIDKKSLGIVEKAKFATGSMVASRSVKNSVRKAGADSQKNRSDESIDTAQNPSDAKLTVKEIDVLKEVVAGKKNKEIAESLGISEVSVKVHKSRMSNKLGVKTLPELALALEKLETLNIATDTSEKELDSKGKE